MVWENLETLINGYILISVKVKKVVVDNKGAKLVLVRGLWNIVWAF